METDDLLAQLRAELLGDDSAEGAAADPTADDLARETLAHLHAEDLHPLSHSVVAEVFAKQLPEGAGDRARRRVTDATVELRRQHHPDPGSMLREARETANISLRQASEVLGIAEAAIDRIERGRGMRSLLNLPARSVADYVRQLDLDPRTLLAALFALAPSEAVYGYTPGVGDEERSRMLSKAVAESHADDRRWALDFLTWAEGGTQR